MGLAWHKHRQRVLLSALSACEGACGALELLLVEWDAVYFEKEPRTQ